MQDDTRQFDDAYVKRKSISDYDTPLEDPLAAARESAARYHKMLDLQKQTAAAMLELKTIPKGELRFQGLGLDVPIFGKSGNAFADADIGGGQSNPAQLGLHAMRKYIPFFSDQVKGNHEGRLAEITDRFQAGEILQPGELNELMTHVALNRNTANQSMVTQIADIVSIVPKFGVELFGAGKVVGGASKLLRGGKAAANTAKLSKLQQGSKWLKGALATSSAAAVLSGAAYKEAQARNNRELGTLQFSEDQNGKVQSIIESIEDEDFWTQAFPKGFVPAWSEYFSEMTGVGIGKALKGSGRIAGAGLKKVGADKVVPRQLKELVARRFVARFPGAGAASFKNFMSQMNIQGWASEWGEERVNELTTFVAGKAVQGVVGGDSVADDLGVLQHLPLAMLSRIKGETPTEKQLHAERQAIVEVLAFGGISASSSVVNKFHSSLYEKPDYFEDQKDFDYRWQLNSENKGLSEDDQKEAWEKERTDKEARRRYYIRNKLFRNQENSDRPETSDQAVERMEKFVDLAEKSIEKGGYPSRSDMYHTPFSPDLVGYKLDKQQRMQVYESIKAELPLIVDTVNHAKSIVETLNREADRVQHNNDIDEGEAGSAPPITKPTISSTDDIDMMLAAEYPIPEVVEDLAKETGQSTDDIMKEGFAELLKPDGTPPTWLSQAIADQKAGGGEQHMNTWLNALKRRQPQPESAAEPESVTETAAEPESVTETAAEPESVTKTAAEPESVTKTEWTDEKLESQFNDVMQSAGIKLAKPAKIVKAQSALEKEVEAIAGQFGVPVKFIEADTLYGGMYNRQSKTIFINTNKQLRANRPVLNTLAHELVHHLDLQFSDFPNTNFDKAKKEFLHKVETSDTHAAYKGRLSDRDVEQEVIASYLTNAMEGDIRQAFAQEPTIWKQLIQLILDAFKNITGTTAATRQILTTMRGLMPAPAPVKQEFSKPDASPDAALSKPIEKRTQDSSGKPLDPNYTPRNLMENLQVLKVDNKDESLFTENTNKDATYPGYYAIVPLNHVIPSDDVNSEGAFTSNFKGEEPKYPGNLQTRDYGSSTKGRQSQEATRKMADKFDPHQVMSPTNDMAQGPPTVTETGVVISGNGRTMVLQMIHRMEQYQEARQAYKEVLNERATVSFSNTDTDYILVRVLKNVNENSQHARNLVDWTNKGIEKEISAATASNIFASIVQEVDFSLDLNFDNPDNNTLQQVINDSKAVVNKIITLLKSKIPGSVNKYVTDQGQLTGPALKSIEVNLKTQIAPIENTGDEGQLQWNMLTDNSNISSQLTNALPHLIALRKSNDPLQEEFVSALFQSSATIDKQAYENLTDLKTASSQTQIFATGEAESIPKVYLPIGEYVFREMRRGKKTLAKQLSKVRALMEPTDGGAMFAAEPLSFAQAFKQVFKFDMPTAPQVQFEPAPEESTGKYDHLGTDIFRGRAAKSEEIAEAETKTFWQKFGDLFKVIPELPSDHLPWASEDGWNNKGKNYFDPYRDLERTVLAPAMQNAIKDSREETNHYLSLLAGNKDNKTLFTLAVVYRNLMAGRLTNEPFRFGYTSDTADVFQKDYEEIMAAVKENKTVQHAMRIRTDLIRRRVKEAVEAQLLSPSLLDENEETEQDQVEAYMHQLITQQINLRNAPQNYKLSRSKQTELPEELDFTTSVMMADQAFMTLQSMDIAKHKYYTELEKHYSIRNDLQKKADAENLTYRFLVGDTVEQNGRWLHNANKTKLNPDNRGSRFVWLHKFGFQVESTAPNATQYTLLSEKDPDFATDGPPSLPDTIERLDRQRYARVQQAKELESTIQRLNAKDKNQRTPEEQEELTAARKTLNEIDPIRFNHRQVNTFLKKLDDAIQNLPDSVLGEIERTSLFSSNYPDYSKGPPSLQEITDQHKRYEDLKNSWDAAKLDSPFALDSQQEMGDPWEHVIYYSSQAKNHAHKAEKLRKEAWGNKGENMETREFEKIVDDFVDRENYEVYHLSLDSAMRATLLTPNEQMLDGFLKQLVKTSNADVFTGHIDLNSLMTRVFPKTKQSYSKMVLPKPLVERLKNNDAKVQRHLGQNAFAAPKALYLKTMSMVKTMLLNAPMRALGYNLRNIVGDTEGLIASHPELFYTGSGLSKDFLDAYTEVSQFFAHHNANKNQNATLDTLFPEKFIDYRQAQKFGALEVSLIDYTVPDVRESKKFKEFVSIMAETKGLQTLADQPGMTAKQLATAVPLSIRNTIRGYFRGANRISHFREQVFRLTAFKAFKSRLQKIADMPASEAHAAIRKMNFGSTLRSTAIKLFETIDESERVDRVAALMSRETLLDYNQLTVGGKHLNDFVFIFHSWTEKNFGRYGKIVSNAIEHARENKEYGTAALQVGRATGAAAVGLTMRIGFMTAVLYAWNKMVQSALDIDPEEDLSRADRNSLYLLMPWRDGENKVVLLRNPSAWGDIMAWFGIAELMNEGINERETVGHYAKNTFNKVALSLNPPIKGGMEFVIGQSLYPDVTNPRPGYRDEIVFNNLGVPDSYRAIKGGLGFGTTPRKGSLARFVIDPLSGLPLKMIGTLNASVNAVYNSYQMFNDFHDDGLERQRLRNSRPNFVRMRAAAMDNDPWAFKRAAAAYKAHDFKPDDNIYETFQRQVHAIKVFPEKHRTAFLQSLNEKQLKIVTNAQVFLSKTQTRMAAWFAEHLDEQNESEKLMIGFKKANALSGTWKTRGTKDKREQAKNDLRKAFRWLSVHNISKQQALQGLERLKDTRANNEKRQRFHRNWAMFDAEK